MSSIAHSPVTIQTSAQSVPSTPGWFGEVTVIAHFLKRQGVFSAIEEQVRFARRRFGHYDTIDFVAVLLGYAISGERTLKTFSERVQPFATAFMHGAVRTGRLASSLDALPLSRGARPDHRRGAAHALSERCAGSSPGARGAAGGIVGSTGNALSGLRCRWHATSRSPTSPASHT